MTGGQCLEARRLLRLTQAAVARKLAASPAVISVFERTGHMPPPLYSRQDRLAVLKAFFERAGLEFTSDAPAGVRLRNVVT